MDLHREQLAGTRVRVLLLASLGAVLWIVLSVFASSTPASAADESGDFLLGTVAQVVDDVPAVSSVKVPVATVVETLAEPVSSTVQHAVPTPLDAAADTITAASALVTGSVQAVLEHPPVTLNELTDAANHVMTVGNDDPGPALVGPHAMTVDVATFAETSTPSTGDIGATSPPPAPAAPTAPTPTESTAPAQNTVNQQPAAAILGSAPTTTMSMSATSGGDDTLPNSVSFGTDSSPD